MASNRTLIERLVSNRFPNGGRITENDLRSIGLRFALDPAAGLPCITLDDDRLLDEHEAALMLNLSVHTLRKDRTGARRIPFVSIGRSCRYRLSRLRELIEQNERGVPA